MPDLRAVDVGRVTVVGGARPVIVVRMLLSNRLNKLVMRAARDARLHWQAGGANRGNDQKQQEPPHNRPHGPSVVSSTRVRHGIRGADRSSALLVKKV